MESVDGGGLNEGGLNGSARLTRTVVISGGGSGIGLAVARWFASRGETVLIVGRRRDVLERSASDITREFPSATAHALAADLEDAAAVEGIPAALGTLGLSRVDVLVANSGGLAQGSESGLAATVEAWRSDFSLNVVTAVLLTEVLLPLLARPGGRVIAISSLAAFQGAGSYGAAKSALHAWVYSMAGELGPDGVTVNAVAPGFIPDTGFWAGRLRPEVTEPRVARTLVKRPGTPDEVAEAVGYFASPLAGFTTGQILQVNGGAALGRG